MVEVLLFVDSCSFQLRPIMQKCSEKLHRCASLVPGDMQHVMAEETQVRQILQVTKWKRNGKDVDCC